MIYWYATLEWKKEDSCFEQSDKVGIRSLVNPYWEFTKKKEKEWEHF